MTTFVIGLVVGTCSGVIVMGLLAARSYEKGAEDMIETLAKRRKGGPPHPVDAPKPWSW